MLHRASEASPEKWSHMRRKRLGTRTGPPAKWQDAAASASLKPVSPPSTTFASLTRPLSTTGPLPIAAQPTDTALPWDADSSRTKWQDATATASPNLVGPPSTDCKSLTSPLSTSGPLPMVPQPTETALPLDADSSRARWQDAAASASPQPGSLPSTTFMSLISPLSAHPTAPQLTNTGMPVIADSGIGSSSNTCPE